MKNTKNFATVNFANMNADAFNMLSTFQMFVTELSLAETDFKKAKDKLKEEGVTNKKDISIKTEKERLAKKNAFDRANSQALTFIIRYISTADAVSGNLYKFDMADFLHNIGVLSEGEVDKKSLKKIEDIRALVVDRVKIGVTKRKNGTDKLTLGDTKEVKNTPIELVLAVVMACIDSGAIEYSKGGLAFVKFDKKGAKK